LVPELLPPELLPPEDLEEPPEDLEEPPEVWELELEPEPEVVLEAEVAEVVLPVVNG